jgi:hypothetical protein
MECRKLLARTSGLGVNEPTSFFTMNNVCTLGHMYAYRDGVPFTYSKCVVSLRKDYAQEEISITEKGKTMVEISLHHSPDGVYGYNLREDGKVSGT